VSSHFRDADGDALTYAAESSDEGVATATVSGSQVRVAGIAPGTATVTVTASDPGGRTATQSFGVAVRGSIGDDFSSSASRNDWEERNNAEVSVGGGVLSVTNRREDRLGIAERTSTPTVNSWTVAARIGRKTRKASPGVVSLTGHRRFTATRLVLRTLDDGGSDRSADSPPTSGNFEFALFDRDTREWVRIANMSGRSAAVREAPDEFTDIAFGHEGGDFVGYAGAGNAEELFRFDMGDSNVDGVALGDILEHLTGVWLVNQSEPGLTAVHDRVEVTGTGSRAPVPDGAEVAEALDAATRSVSVAGADADRAALEAFYEAAGGPNWTNNDGWLTAAPLGDWHGVTTDSRGRVTELELTENNLTGEIPPELGDLTALTTLDFFRNHLTGEIPSELRSLTNLRRLHLNGNGLTGGIPPELGELRDVRMLAFGWNDLTGEIPPELGRLASLGSLDLRHNSLTGEIPPELGDLANLGTLRLGWNGFTGGVPPELGGIPDLSHLYVNDNRLAGPLPTDLLSLSLSAFRWDDNAGLCAPQTSEFEAWLAAIGDHAPGPYCVEGPEAVGTIPAETLAVGETVTVDVSSYFRDSDGDRLTYAALSSDTGVAAASMEGTALIVTGVAAGTATVMVTATDPAGLTATQAVAVTVRTANRPPEAVSGLNIGNLSVGQSASNDMNQFFRDPDGDALTYSASSSDAGVAAASMSESILTVTGVARGTATATVTAADPAGLTAMQNVAVTVVERRNRAPEAVGTIPSINVPAGGSESVDVSSYFRDPDGDALTYSASSRLPGLAAASMSGSVVTVTGVESGRTTVTVTAADPGELTATQRVSVTVGPPNRAPEAVGSIPSIGLPIGGSEPVEVSSYFQDPDGDALTYSADSSDEGVAAASMSGSVVTVTGVASGQATVTVTAADPGGLTATQSVAVTVGTGNRAPETVGTIPPQRLEPSGESSLDVSPYFHDPDGDALTYTASSSDEGVVEATMWVTDNRLLVLNADAEGSASVTVTATDPSGLTATQTVTVTVQPNRAPEVVGNRNSWGVLSVNSGYSYSGLSSSFRDPDGDTLVYSATSSDEDIVTVSMNGDTMIVTTHNQTGTATISVTATDPGGLSATQSAPVQVN